LIPVSRLWDEQSEPPDFDEDEREDDDEGENEE